MIRPALRAAGVLLLVTMLPAFAADSAASSTRARRIAEQCVLPDFPPDVVSQDSALSLALQLTVNPDGAIGKLELVRASGWPAYDQAVLAAAAHCTYIPALHDGKPVAVSEVWEIVRVPGTRRP
ncbi:MAG TPA: energy transducer TonB [Telluria sp.]|jgi:TonB family protein